MRTRSARTKIALGIMAFGACLTAPASPPFGVSVLNSQYTTYVFVQTNGANANVGTGTSGDFAIWSGGNSRMTLPPIPTSDSMSLGGSGTLAAEANVDTFGVSAFSDMVPAFPQGWPGHNSTAGAESEIWFSPLTGGTATIGLDFSGAYTWYYSSGFVSLSDVTAGQTLWNYGWNGLNLLDGSNWMLNPDGTASATYSFQTDFNPADTFKLTMYTQTFADYDEEQTAIQLSGLVEAIPEPSAIRAWKLVR